MATLPKAPKLKRVDAVDFSDAEEALKAAAYLIVPEDQTQHQAFLKMMPHLFVMRNRGCSFRQITAVLTKFRFTLQPSTVKDYYNNALATRMDICQERMNEQILLMAEIKKVTKGTEVSSIADRVTAMMEKKRMAAAPKLDSLFGSPSATPVAQTSPVGSSVAPKPDSAENKKTGLRPAPENAPENEVGSPLVPSDSSDSFGLLNLKPAAKKAATKVPAFFSQDDAAPVIPVLQVADPIPENKNSGLRPAPPSESPKLNTDNKDLATKTLRCLPLKAGVEMAKRRASNPDEVYEVGDLEHPRIPGLMLSLDERLYTAAIEYTNDDGEVMIETLDEKRFRLTWKYPMPMTPTMTGHSFTKMDENAFKKL